MDKQEIHLTLKIIKENPDGSAEFQMDCNSYTTAKLAELGVITLLKQYIEQEKLDGKDNS